MIDWDAGDAPEDPDRPTGGRHRAPVTSGQQVIYRFLAPIGAIVAVVLVVVVLIVVRGHGSGSGPGPGVIVAPTRTPIITPSTTPSEATTPTPSVALTHPAPTSSEPVTRHHPPAWKTAMAPVRVYNSTHITGMAHQVAAEIAAKGWTVPVVGNVTATSSITTLYYSPNNKDAARHLAHQFSGIRRIKPNGAEQLDYHGLTLVLTADWQT